MIRTSIDLTTSEIILALCRAREIERGFGKGGHTTRATQDAAIAALTMRQPKEATDAR